MKVVIAPDSFKESLHAAEVAEAIAAGVLEANPQAFVDLCPLADGGPGTVAALVAVAPVVVQVGGSRPDAISSRLAIAINCRIRLTSAPACRRSTC